MDTMNKIICTLVMTTSLAVATAYAQAPAPSHVTAVATGGAQPGALTECYSAIGDQLRTALQACLQQKLGEANLQMTSAYEKVMTSTKQADSIATPRALGSLRKAQKTFENFRVAQCQWKGDSAMGGSGAGDFTSACKVDLTRWRATQLAN